MSVYIVSVGTSVISNYKRENPYRAELKREEIIDFLKSNIEKGLLNYTSAEIKTILKCGLSEKDSIYLLLTDTDDGKISGETLAMFFENYFNVSGLYKIVISGLQVEDVRRFKEEGVPNLFSTLLDIEVKTRGEERKIVLSGGFKAVVPYLTIAGILYKIPVVYIFERTDDVIELPPFPLNRDYTVFKENREIFLRLSKEGKIDEDVYLRNLSHYAGINFILKKDGRDYVFTENGKILYLSYTMLKEND